MPGFSLKLTKKTDKIVSKIVALPSGGKKFFNINTI